MKNNIVEKGLVLGIIVLFIVNSGVSLSQGLKVTDRNIIDSKNNPWTPEDEGDHFPIKNEWWTFHVALELENSEKTESF